MKVTGGMRSGEGTGPMTEGSVTNLGSWNKASVVSAEVRGNGEAGRVHTKQAR